MFAEHWRVPRLKTRNYYIFVLKYLHLHKIHKINLLLVKKKRMYLAKIIFIRFNLKNDKVKAKAIYNSRKEVLMVGLEENRYRQLELVSRLTSKKIVS